LGDSERALSLFLEAEQQARRLGDVTTEVNWLKTAAYVYRANGQLAEARDTLQRALNLAKEIHNDKDMLGALEDLSHVSVEIGDLSGADIYIKQAASMAITVGNSTDVAYVNLARGKLAAARHEDSQAESLFRGVEGDPASQVSMRFAAEHELALLYQAENRPVQAEQMYRTALATFEGAREQLKDEDSKLPFVANAKGIYDDYVRFLVEQNKRELALMTADQSRARTLAQGLGMMAEGKSFHPAAVSAQAVARKTDTTLLFYWLGERQSYLWAVTPRETAMFPLPAEKEILPLVERYDRDLLGAGDPVESGNVAGQQLYRMLVQPAEKLIGPDGRVMLMTDGPLSRLNFEALIVPADTEGHKAHYWIEDATVSSAPSISMLAGGLAEQSTGRESNARLLLLGNPQSPSADYPTLPYAGQEMAEIEKQFGRSGEVVFAGSRATPAAYLDSKPEAFPYIHFVSHGVASRTDPLDSAIILSRPGSGDEDSFKLYAREIMRHPIQARLVTISACYGSGTRAYTGEGLVGLSWAFLRAGAQRAIGALWEASDRSTPELMSTLYEGLEAGQNPAVALRNAKLKLLHSGGNFRKPFYWAAFQLYTRV
jgi:CHAT domain-containing protein